LTVSIITNFFTYERQLEEKDLFFKFVDVNVFLNHPEIKNEVLNYMLDILVPTSDNIKELLDLMRVGEAITENQFLRGQSSVINNDITSNMDIKFNLFRVHKVDI
jgi:hypothetical protein